MNIKNYKRNAISNLFEYLDARNGKLTIIYENAYIPIIEEIKKFELETNRDINYIDIDSVSHKDIYKSLTDSEKFLCAFNRTWEKGFSEKFDVMLERAISLAFKAYTMSDLSSVFYDIFQAKPNLIKELNMRLIRILQSSENLLITDENGTGLDIKLDNKYDWVNMDGFSEMDFDLTCNLPIGEVATYSPNVTGEIFFTGALLGTIPIGRNHGNIEDPIHIKVENNEIKEIKTNNKSLLKDLEICLYHDKYTHMVNEVAIGTNMAIPSLTGLNYKYEEHQFGFHIGFGASLAQQNVERVTPHHLDFIFKKSNVFVDGILLYDGKFHFDKFPISEKNVPLRISKKTCCTITN